MAATSTLGFEPFAEPSFAVNISLLALSTRNSGMIINELTLKFADNVVAKMLPPVIIGEVNTLRPFLSLKYSSRKVRPNQLVGSAFTYNAEPHQLLPSRNLPSSRNFVLLMVPL